jgi:L-alanine-DL-glutamate epimerase-like enolase superfamily enzyme
VSGGSEDPLLPHLVGASPERREALWHKLYNRGIPVAPQAHSAVDILMWDLAAKAAGLPADEVVIDLEDAVAASAKDEARADVVSALAGGQMDGRTVAVRVNGLDTPWCARQREDQENGRVAARFGVRSFRR